MDEALRLLARLTGATWTETVVNVPEAAFRAGIRAQVDVEPSDTIGVTEELRNGLRDVLKAVVSDLNWEDDSTPAGGFWCATPIEREESHLVLDRIELRMLFDPPEEIADLYG
jgi:hypothetical protein